MKTDKLDLQKEVMLHKKNPLSGDWLCWIPGTPQAYYCQTKKEAKEFCDNVNNAFKKGELRFNEEGRVVKVNIA